MIRQILLPFVGRLLWVKYNFAHAKSTHTRVCTMLECALAVIEIDYVSVIFFNHGANQLFLICLFCMNESKMPMKFTKKECLYFHPASNNSTNN